ncbi:MAG: CoA-binding protein [Flavobacterium sp.]|uniref:CoA-binding protein n=1 Tax=Flavobacterium sp. TaxID=239 RepID=UPI001DA0BBA4|nr:CoA-binding protein [Flavobacterium sp.]
MKKTLVIGASENPSRYSYRAIQNLLDKQHAVVAIGQKGGKVNDITIQTKQIPFKNIDTVTLYLNPIAQRGYYNYIIGLQPKRVIFNPGTENPAFYPLLQSNGIEVEVACTLVLLATNQY